MKLGIHKILNILRTKKITVEIIHSDMFPFNFIVICSLLIKKEKKKKSWSVKPSFPMNLWEDLCIFVHILPLGHGILYEISKHMLYVGMALHITSPWSSCGIQSPQQNKSHSLHKSKSVLHTDRISWCNWFGLLLTDDEKSLLLLPFP